MFRRPVLIFAVVAGVASAVNWSGVAREQPANVTRKQLMDADRAFFKAASERGIDGWMSFMADDAVRIAPIGDKAVTGRQAVRELDSPLFADPGKRLIWEPTDGGTFADGKHGFTTGRARIVARNDAGADEATWTGAYVTIWHQAADGSWKVILDTGAGEAVKLKSGSPAN